LLLAVVVFIFMAVIVFWAFVVVVVEVAVIFLCHIQSCHIGCHVFMPQSLLPLLLLPIDNEAVNVHKDRCATKFL
jgi:hypothetical protein